MAVDPQLGVVVWQPTLDQAGLAATVLLRVTDTKGSVALQSFTVNVLAANQPPVITSTPPTGASPGLPYQYAVAAQDRIVPRKSTSFGPKPRSGLVIRTFADS